MGQKLTQIAQYFDCLQPVSRWQYEDKDNNSQQNTFSRNEENSFHYTQENSSQLKIQQLKQIHAKQKKKKSLKGLNKKQIQQQISINSSISDLYEQNSGNMKTDNDNVDVIDLQKMQPILMIGDKHLMNNKGKISNVLNEQYKSNTFYGHTDPIKFINPKNDENQDIISDGNYFVNQDDYKQFQNHR